MLNSLSPFLTLSFNVNKKNTSGSLFSRCNKKPELKKKYDEDYLGCPFTDFSRAHARFSSFRIGKADIFLFNCVTFIHS